LSDQSRLAAFLVLLTTGTALTETAFGRGAQPVILQIDVENYVQYRGDVQDPLKFAQNPSPTTAPAIAFMQNVQVGDIMAVNGKPAKGLWQNRFVIMPFRLNPAPGQPVADLDSTGLLHCQWEILAPDGSYVGSLMDGGTGSNHALMGGVGAFANVTGVKAMEILVPARVASFSEDPSMRRINGGGKIRATFYIYPAARPRVQMTANGPAVFHGDFSLVTPANPAHPGETLILRATGLGPVKPDLTPPGTELFTADPLQEVNSPVDVAVNGSEVPAINKVGWPRETDVYRVDFQMPADVGSGTATIHLTAAWIPGPTVTIPVK